MNISKSPTGLKASFVGVYSAIIFYIFIYKGVIESIYPIYNGADFGGLAILVGWFMYSLAQTPVLLILSYATPQQIFSNKKYLFYYSVALIPLTVGALLLIIVTFTGRQIFQPIYTAKTRDLESKIQISPATLIHKQVYEKNCDCVVPVKEGTFSITNNVEFPVTVEITNTLDDICQIDSYYAFLLKKGHQDLKFNCGIRDVSKINANPQYQITLKENNNNAVTIKKSLTTFY